MGHVLLDLAFLLVCVFFVFLYAKRGLIKSLVHFFKTLLAFVIAFLLGDKLGAVLCDKWIGGAVNNFVYGKIQALYANASDGLSADAMLKEFPSFLRTESMQQTLSGMEGSGDAMVQSATDAISAPIATAISNVLGYVAVFLLALVFLWIAAALLTKIVERITILGTLNTVLGGIFGFVIAILILFAVSSVIRLFFGGSPIYGDSVFVKLLGDSALLEKIKIFDLGAL